MPTSDELTAFIDALGGALMAFRDALRQLLKAAGTDLTSEMLPVMRYLWAHDGANQQEIANAVGRDKATLTAMIDNLVRRELVTRCEDSQDRRSKRIVLTAKGLELEQRIAPAFDAMITQAGRHVTTSQLRASAAVLELMNNNLKETHG
jgi:DNA-binding MarR family transcriptional regulator